MPEGFYRLEIAEHLETVLESLSSTEQAEILEILEGLEQNPHIDGVRKTSLPTRHGDICFYTGDRVWVSYRILDGHTIAVVNGGPLKPPPPGLMWM